MSKWAVNRNFPTTLLEFSGWEFEEKKKKKYILLLLLLELVRNLMAHAQKPDFVFRLNGRVHLNRLGSQFS